MREFSYTALKHQKWDLEIVSLIAAIYREQGRQELYLKQRPQDLQRLIEIAKVQSTESSNAIEGIVTSSTRIRQLVNEKTTPRNRSEMEIAGYRDVLNLIHENFEVIPLSKNYLLQMHKIMYRQLNVSWAGKTKNVQNYIVSAYPDGHKETIFTPTAPYETPEALEKICSEYNKAVSLEGIEPLLVIPVFIHDFLCIHPFNDGNGRMSRLLTALLLYREHFYVGRYISLEARIAKSKEQYYSTLRQSQEGWHEGRDDPLPFIKYLLGTILDAYRDFADRMELVGSKKSALQTVRQAAEFKLGYFTKQDIIELCPSLSLSSVEGALRVLTAAGFLQREGRGRSTRYFRQG